MGRPRRRGIDIHGVVLIDKPGGYSSNDVLQKVKHLFNANKAGHTGALDPIATGMLPICLGEATKFSQFLLDADKTYRVIARLGERTTTSDSEGEIVATRAVNITRDSLDTHIQSFLGETDQIPSMFSALKYQGKPLYDYARQGISIPREARKITVYSIELIRFSGDELELQIHCSKGTYIRTIIDDLGEKLGCGAHVISLRRLQVANYPFDRMITLDALMALKEAENALDHLLLPMDSAVVMLPEIQVNTIDGNALLQGKRIQVSSSAKSGLCRIKMGEKPQFIGIGELDDEGYLQPKRLIVESAINA